VIHDVIASLQLIDRVYDFVLLSLQTFAIRYSRVMMLFRRLPDMYSPSTLIPPTPTLSVISTVLIAPSAARQRYASASACSRIPFYSNTFCDVIAEMVIPIQSVM